MIIFSIRDGIKSKWSKILLFIVCLSFLGGIGFSTIIKHFFGGVSADAFIVVNQKEITKNQFDAKKQEEEQRISFFYRQFGKNAPLMMMQHGLSLNPEETAINALIEEAVMQNVIRFFPVYVSDVYITNKVQDPYFLMNELYYILPPNVIGADGTFDFQVLQKCMYDRYQGQMLDSYFKEKIEQSIALALVQTAIYEPRFFADAMLKELSQTKRFSQLSLPLDAFVKQAREWGANDAELKLFFDEENKKRERYYIPAKRNGVEYSFEVKHFEITISDREIEDYYNKVKRERFVQTPTQFKIREIIFNDVKNNGLIALKKEAETVYMTVLQNQIQFAELAKQHSQKKESAKNGGLVDYFKRGEKEKSIERAVIMLKNDDDISPIIELENNQGYAIIQRLGRKEATFKSLNEVKKEVEITIKERKFAVEFVRQANRYVNAQDEEGKKQFEVFIQKHKGVKRELEAMQKNEGVNAARLFSLKKRGDRVVFLAEKKGIILEVRDILTKQLPPFELFKPYVEKDFFEKKGYEALKKAIDEVLKKAYEAGKLESSFHKHAVVKSLGWVNLLDEKQLEKLTKEGVSSTAFTLDVVGHCVSSTNEKEAAIVMLDELKVEKEADQDERINKLKETIHSLNKSLYTRAFIASLHRTATIDIKKVALENRKNDVYEI